MEHGNLVDDNDIDEELLWGNGTDGRDDVPGRVPYSNEGCG